MKFVWTLTAVTLLCTAGALAQSVKGRSGVERFEQKRVNNEETIESVEGREEQPTTVESVRQNQKDESRYLSVNPIGSLPSSWSNQQVVSSDRPVASPQVVPQRSYWSKKNQVPSYQPGRIVVPVAERVYYMPQVATKTVQQPARYINSVNTVPARSGQNVQSVSVRPVGSRNQVWGQKVSQPVNVQVSKPVSAPVVSVRNQNLVAPTKPVSMQTVSVVQPVRRLYGTKSVKGATNQGKPFYQSMVSRPQPAGRSQTYTYTAPRQVFQYQIKRPQNVVSTVSVPSSVSRVVYNVPTQAMVVQQPIQSRSDVVSQQPDWSVRQVQPFQNMPVSVRTLQPVQSTSNVYSRYPSVQSSGNSYSNYPSFQTSSNTYSNYPSVQTSGNTYSNYPSVQSSGNTYSNYPSVQSTGTVYRGYSPVQQVQTVPVQSVRTIQAVPVRQVPYQTVSTVQASQPLTSGNQVQTVEPVSSGSYFQAAQPVGQTQFVQPAQVQSVQPVSQVQTVQRLSPVQSYRVVQPTYYTMPVVSNQQEQSVQPQVVNTYSVKGGQMPVTTVTIEDAPYARLVQNQDQTQAQVQSVSGTESQVSSSEESKDQVESSTISVEANTESNVIGDEVVDEPAPVSPVEGNVGNKVVYSVPTEEQVSQQEQSNQAVTEQTQVQSRSNWASQQQQQQIEQVYITDEDGTEPLELSPIDQSSK